MSNVVTLLATVMRAADPKNVRQGTYLRNRLWGLGSRHQVLLCFQPQHLQRLVSSAVLVCDGFQRGDQLVNLRYRVIAGHAPVLMPEDIRDGVLTHIGFPQPAKTTGRRFRCRLFICVATVTLGVFVNSLAGFAFAVFEFPFKRALFAVVLLSFMMPFDRGRIVLAGA